MPVYTVHAPEGADPAVGRGADKFAFVRDGFSFWAFLFGLLWLLYNRLWLAALGYLVVISAGYAALWQLHAGTGVWWAVNFLIALLMGLEGPSLRRWSFSRGRWRQIDTVVADDEEAAEHRFFERLSLKSGGLVNDPLAVERGGPPPTRDIPGQPFSRPPAVPHDIVGLFPNPGGDRR
jgi:hypothetical protein